MIDIFIQAEEMILLFVQEVIRNPLLTPFFTAVTRLGDNGILWIVTAAVLLFPKKTRKIGCMMFLALLGSLIINNLFLKNLVARVRPYEAIPELLPLIEKQPDDSFPSGHTASSFAAASILFRRLPRRFGVPALLLAALIAFSRLYLGVHYLSDILCGLASGVVISYAAEAAVEEAAAALSGKFRRNS